MEYRNKENSPKTLKEDMDVRSFDKKHYNIRGRNSWMEEI